MLCVIFSYWMHPGFLHPGIGGVLFLISNSCNKLSLLFSFIYSFIYFGGRLSENTSNAYIAFNDAHALQTATSLNVSP